MNLDWVAVVWKPAVQLATEEFGKCCSLRSVTPLGLCSILILVKIQIRCCLLCTGYVSNRLYRQRHWGQLQSKALIASVQPWYCITTPIHTGNTTIKIYNCYSDLTSVSYCTFSTRLSVKNCRIRPGGPGGPRGPDLPYIKQIGIILKHK